MPRREAFRGAWDFSSETTLVRVLAANAAAFPERVAMREKDRGIWQPITWRELTDTVLACAAGLARNFTNSQAASGDLVFL